MAQRIARGLLPRVIISRCHATIRQFGGRSARTRQHSEQVTRIVGVGDNVKRLKEPGSFQPDANIAERRKVLDGKADTVKKCDLAFRRPARRAARHDLPHLSHREIGRHLLNLALDPGLRGVFNEHVGPAQDVGVQFGLAGAITANGVDVDACVDPLKICSCYKE